MNQRSIILFLPSLLLFSFGAFNITKKRLHSGKEMASIEVTSTEAHSSGPGRGPASLGSPVSLPMDRLSFNFAQDLLAKKLKSGELPHASDFYTRQYEAKLKDLGKDDGYPDQPEIFLNHLCQEGTAGACPLLWNLWQQPGTNDESSVRKQALLLLSCIETGTLCNEALLDQKGTTIEKPLRQLTSKYCLGGIASACEEIPQPVPSSNLQRVPASIPSALPDLRSQSLRRCENDSAIDCVHVAALEARDRNLEAAFDYADFSCSAGLAEGCLQLAKIQYQKTHSWNSTKEGLQKLCNQPYNFAANSSLCHDLSKEKFLSGNFFSTHPVLRSPEGLRVAGNLQAYFMASW